MILTDKIWFVLLLVCGLSACKSTEKCDPKISQYAKQIKFVEPSYPRIAAENGLEGTVQVMIYIDEQGKVVTAQIKKSSNYSSLDRASLNAAKSAVFEPAICNGQPIKSTASQTFKFALDD